MPDILDRCVKDVMAKGNEESSAWAICRTSLNMENDLAKMEKRSFDPSSDENDMERVIDNAIKMCDEIKMNKQNFSFETKDISGVEIFASGTWNGDTFTIEDVDKIINAIDATKDKIKPYLKLVHDGKQKLLQKDGYPAAGYIEKLYRVGNKLVADFVKVPKIIYDLLKTGGYRRVSS